MIKAPLIIFLPAAALLAGCAGADRILASGPADPAIASSTPPYRSAFDGIEPVKDEPPLAWFAANEEMRRLGGHSGHTDGESDAHAAHRAGGVDPESTGSDRASGQPAGHKH